jgi:hypothetical protein
MMDTLATITELPDELRTPMLRQMNKGLMVAWITPS